jgi:cation:H+ antiporter
MTDALWLALGLGLLIKSADLFVQGASSIATKAGVSPLVVGLTVVAFGTSTPEMSVSLLAGIQSNPDLAISNVIGSNIANVLLVLGIAAMIRPLPVQESTVVSEIPFSLTAALLVGFLANAALFSPLQELSISRLDGVILLFFFALFMIYLFRIAHNGTTSEEEPGNELTGARTTLYIGLGLIGLYFGGQLTVDGAIGVGRFFGVSDALIGLTIVAAGTSAPELVTSAVAAYRNQTDIAVGNVVGSNIFNLLLISGLTASVVDLPFDVVSNTDLAMVILSSALIIFAMIVSRRSAVLRSHGAVFVLIYMAYIYYLIQR